jgi:hypothetical protein
VPEVYPVHYDPALGTAQARAAYAAAWRCYLLTAAGSSRLFYAHVMDAVAGRCVASGAPGPEWTSFTDALPGYGAFWARWEKVHGAPLRPHFSPGTSRDPETDPECS